MSASFDDRWNMLLRCLRPGESIPNWTVLKGYLGDRMQVLQVTRDEIVIQAPNAKNLVCVSRGEFEKVWEIWPAYRARRMRRKEITEITFFSKYIFSILHWLEQIQL